MAGRYGMQRPAHVESDAMSKNTTSSKVEKIPPSDPRHPEYGAHLQWLRGLSMEERGRMIVEACRKTAEERRKAGLPRTESEPFPPSTMELFRRLVAEGHKDNEAALANDSD